MSSYQEFAKVYDLFMDNVPYEEWAKRIRHLLQDNGIKDGLLLDLGCGTGTMTRLLQSAGYDMIGIDASEEMLMEAREAGYTLEDTEDAFDTKPTEDLLPSDILYLCQDMTSFELYGTVRAIVSVCDCMNYLLTEEDLLSCFLLANNYLDPKGIFLFDMNTLAKYEAMGETTICENREEGSFIWENYYNPQSQENEYDVTFYMESQEVPGLYERFEETHLQKGYSLETIQRLLTQAGMEFLAAYDGYSSRPYEEGCERMLIMAREQGKKQILSP